MEIINDLRADIVKLQAEIQSLKVQVAKPPVVNIDTAKLATVITDKLSGYTVNMWGSLSWDVQNWKMSK